MWWINEEEHTWYPCCCLENKMRAIIPQVDPSDAAADSSQRPRLSTKQVWTDVISANATNIVFIPSTFLLPGLWQLIIPASALLGLMNFTYKYHADTDTLCTEACILASSSISPIYVARPGFTFKARGANSQTSIDLALLFLSAID